MGPVLQVIAGLYYTIAGYYIFRKLVGTEEFDLVTPTSVGRPTIDGSKGSGLLGFSAGLYGPTRIPDSGVFGSDPDPWTVKMPWEIHLRRNAPTDPGLYDPEHPYWKEYAERRTRELREKLDDPDVLVQPPKDALPQEVQFELRGQWWDYNFKNQKVADFAFEFLGTRDFVEVTLGHMQNMNSQQGQPGTQDPLQIGADPTRLKPHPPEERPVFFHKVFDPYAGVTNDWQFGFEGIHLVPIKNTNEKRLRRWFNYADPEAVTLALAGTPAPEEQELDYDWW